MHAALFDLCMFFQLLLFLVSLLACLSFAFLKSFRCCLLLLHYYVFLLVPTGVAEGAASCHGGQSAEVF